jgi:hypothetical protein
MPADPDAVLALLRDPNVDSQQVSDATGASREDAARAARLVAGIARAQGGEALSLPAPLAAAVARAAFGAGRADVLAPLAAHPSREVAKEAKRGLHLLKARGVAVPETPRPAPPPVPAPAEGPELPCYASAIDGQGERALWISRAVPGKGVEVGQAVLSDMLGLLELQVGLLGRKEFRAFGHDIAEKGRAMGVGEIDRETARSLAAAARRLNDASGRRVPEGADAWLARLGPAAPPEDPALRFPALPDEEERAAVEASGRLHELPVLRGWLADEEALRALAHKLDEIDVSPLYVDERQRAEQAARSVAEAVEGYFDEPRRHRLAGRLFAVAAHLEGAGDPASARLAAAVARALATGVAPSRIPFARLLVEKAFPPPGAAPDAARAAPRPGGPEPLILSPR